jgi:hypothetical protein
MESAYPVIRTEEETKEIISQKINEGLHKERIKEMLSQRNELERDLKHHRRWEKKWNKFDWVFKIGGSILVIGTGAAVGVVSGIFLGGILVPLSIAFVEVGMGSGFIGIDRGFFHKKKKYHKDKCKIIEEYLNKSWHYIEGSREDDIITLKEIEGFNSLMNEYRSKMEGIQDVEIDIDMVKLHKDVKKEAHKVVLEIKKKELIEKAVEDKKRSILNSTVAYGTLNRR